MNSDINPMHMRHAIRTLINALLAAGITTIDVRQLADILDAVEKEEQ